MSETYSSFNTDTWLWFLQRVTAGLLIFTVAFHFLWLHFVNHAAEITLQGSAFRMSQMGYLLTMLLFLVTGAFHGVNGVYNAFINQGLDGTPKQVMKWVLVGAGLLVVVQGFRVASAMAGVTV